MKTCIQPPKRPLSIQLFACFLFSLGLAACHQPGSFVWVEHYSQQLKMPENEYLIAPGDVIFVRVYNQDSMSAKTRVRSDGKVSLPFLNDVSAAGCRPDFLAQQLQTRLKEYINTPVVTVSIEEARTVSVSVLGEVTHPGIYSLESPPRVLQALASAGGLTEYAHRDEIFVIRQTPAPVKIRFSYERLAQASEAAAQFQLRSGDVLVVE